MKKTSSAMRALALMALASGCSTPKYAYHMQYKLNSCGKPVSREAVVEALVRKGFLKSSESKGPYDVLHKPQIMAKGAMAVDPFEDRAGDIAVAVCPGTSESYILSEEVTHCKDRKDCTKQDQEMLRKVAEDWSCQVSEKASHSKAWSLEDRQDWTKESCSFIVTNLDI